MSRFSHHRSLGVPGGVSVMGWTCIFAFEFMGCSGWAIVDSVATDDNEKHSERIQRIREIRDRWTLVCVSGDTAANITIDSMGTESLFVHVGGIAAVTPIDSIAFVILEEHAVLLSTRSKLMGLAGGIIGGIVFWNNVPGQSIPVLSVEFTYGVESGCAILVGALMGFGAGYIIDAVTPRPESFDLRKESPVRKRQIIMDLCSRPM